MNNRVSQGRNYPFL